MTFKEFIKPRVIKLVVMVILYGIGYGIVTLDVMYASSASVIQKITSILSWLLTWPTALVYFFRPQIGFVVVGIAMIFYWYLLACLAVWLFTKKSRHLQG